MPSSPAFETSAGGLAVRMVDGRAQAVLIGRSGRTGRLRWSMPKGHVEAGESLEQTAVREVREETGIEATVLAPLGSFRYTFTSQGRHISKRVHHFLMRAVGGELSDADIEVTEVRWLPLERVIAQLAFPAERRIARRAMAILADTE